MAGRLVNFLRMPLPNAAKPFPGCPRPVLQKESHQTTKILAMVSGNPSLLTVDSVGASSGALNFKPSFAAMVDDGLLEDRGKCRSKAPSTMAG